MTPCAAKTPAAAWKNPTGGRHGLPRRIRQARGSACRRRRKCAPAGHGAANVGAGEAGAIEKSSGGRANSLRIRRVAAYTAHSSVASPESRTTSSFGRGRKKRQDGRFPRQGCGIPDARDKLWTPQQLLRASAARQPHSARRAGQRASPALPPKKYEAGAAQCGADPHPAFEHFQERTCPFPREVRGIPKLRGSRDAPRTMPETSDATKPTPGWKQPSPQGTEKSPGTNETRRETADAATDNTVGNSHCRSPGRASVHVPQDSPARFCSNKHDTPRPSAPRNGTRPVPGTKKGVPQNRNSAERLTVTAQGLPGASIAPSPTG